MALRLGTDFSFITAPNGSAAQPPQTNAASNTTTSDASTAFTQQGTLPNTPGAVNYMLRDGSVSQLVYAAADNGLYKSLDDGDTWLQIRKYSNPAPQGLRLGYGPFTNATGVTMVCSNVTRGSDGFTITGGARKCVPTPRHLRVASGGTLPSGWQQYNFNDTAWSTPVAGANAIVDSTQSLAYAQPLSTASAGLAPTGGVGDNFLFRQKFSLAAASTWLTTDFSANQIAFATNSFGSCPAGFYFFVCTFSTGATLVNGQVVNLVNESPAMIDSSQHFPNKKFIEAGQGFAVYPLRYPDEAVAFTVYMSQPNPVVDFFYGAYTGPFWQAAPPLPLYFLGNENPRGYAVFITSLPDFSTAPTCVVPQNLQTSTNVNGVGTLVDNTGMSKVNNAILHCQACTGGAPDIAINMGLTGIYVNGTFVGSVASGNVDANGHDVVASFDVTNLINLYGDNIVAAQVTLNTSTTGHSAVDATAVNWRIDFT